MTAGEAVEPIVPRYRRRQRLAAILTRRRNARALDRWMDSGDDLSTAEVIYEPYEGDWWLDIGMTLGVAERALADEIRQATGTTVPDPGAVIRWLVRTTGQVTG